MKKTDQNCLDSVDTHNDSPDNPMTSFHLKNNLSGSRIERADQSTMTDQLLCNCACEQIPKLKQKAHKSFMQVIQIENLYKEEIAQLKQYFGERQKNKDKQYKYKEQLLNEKCKQLEAEVEKVKQNYNMERAYEIQIQSNPFTIDNIETISYNPLLDESNSSLFNLKEFVNKQNITESTNIFQKQIKGILEKIQVTTEITNIQVFVKEGQDIADKLFEFIKELKDQTILAYEKYNETIRNSGQSEGKHNKLVSMYESLQKQGKFMTQHIKRLSRQKIEMERKFNELQRSNKALEEYIKHLKKSTQEKAVSKKKDSQVVSNKDVVYFNQEGELDVSLGSLVSSKTNKRSITRNSNPMQQNEQGFKKKTALFQKIEK